jgi:hypothetical protein
MKPNPAKPPKGASIPKVAPKNPKLPAKPITSTPVTRKPPVKGKPVEGPKAVKSRGMQMGDAIAPTKAQKNAYDMKKAQERYMAAKARKK